MLRNVRSLGVLIPLILIHFISEAKAQATKVDLPPPIAVETPQTFPWVTNAAMSQEDIAQAKSEWVEQNPGEYAERFDQPKSITITRSQFEALDPEKQQALLRDYKEVIITE